MCGHSPLLRCSPCNPYCSNSNLNICTRTSEELLRHLKVGRANIFGYSMGGTVALGVAIRHPDLVAKVAVLGSSAGRLAVSYDQEYLQQFRSLDTNFAPAVLKEPYDRMVPDPGDQAFLILKKFGKCSLKDAGKRRNGSILVAVFRNKAPHRCLWRGRFGRISGSPPRIRRNRSSQFRE